MERTDKRTQFDSGFKILVFSRFIYFFAQNVRKIQVRLEGEKELDHTMQHTSNKNGHTIS